MLRIKNHERPSPAATNGKAIICNQTGKTYPSILAASKDTGLAKSSICHHLNERQGYENVHGFTFKKAV